MMWNWRMLALGGEARYADLIEHNLYNAVLPGVSLDGQHYFYQNPLADDGSHRRQPWFGCACCPPNVVRLLASLPSYFYGTSVGAIRVHLYAEGVATIELDENRTIRLDGKEPAISMEPDLLGGVTVLQAEARLAAPDSGWEDHLYRTVYPPQGETHATRITAVPYYACANREPCAMHVWLRNG